MDHRKIPRRAALGILAGLATTVSPAGAALTYAPLFRIERSKNANIVQYDAATVTPERLDPRRPVVAYWVMHAEDGRREGLTGLEQRAYGYRVIVEREGVSYLMVLRATSDRSIRVVRWNDRWIAQTRIGGKNGVLERIFVASDDSGLIPSVRWVDLFGYDIVTRAPLVERLKPG